MSLPTNFFIGRGGGVVLPAEVLFTTVGTHDWVVPTGVETISAVLVGAGGTGAQSGAYGGANGGDLLWINDFSVTAGETLRVIVPNGNPARSSGSNNGDPARMHDLTVSFNIGASTGTSFGNNPSSLLTNANNPYPLSFGSRTYTAYGYNTGGRSGGTSGGGSISAGGGGAAGYSGNGGDGGGNTGSYRNPTAGSGGGGGGGGADNTGGGWGAGGGGVGLYGEGASGAAGVNDDPNNGYYAQRGYGGSGGGNGGNGGHNQAGGGGLYGGGGGSPLGESGSPIYGSQGAVRILWGEGRAFPSTNVDLASSTGGQTIF